MSNRGSDSGASRPVSAVREAPGASCEPSVDVYETRDEIVVLVDIPGASAEQIDLSFEEGMLSLHAGARSRGAAPGGGQVRPLLSEYAVRNYERTFRVGDGVDSSRIAADLNDGVLTLRLPKLEAVKPRKIRVQTTR